MKDHLHLVVRFSETMFGVGDVVTKHNEIVVKQGAVWFGKLGHPFSKERIDILNQQVEKKIPTFLYLVKGNRQKSTAYRAPLLQVSKEVPKEKGLFPTYYADNGMIPFMSSWVKIGQIEVIKINEMDKLIAIKSVFPITETLARSPAGYFFVRESKSIS